VELTFDDVGSNNEAFSSLINLISKQSLKKLASAKRDELMESSFDLEPVTLEQMTSIFSKLHQFIWQTEKKTPSGAFQELMKIVFIKIKKDGELRQVIGKDGKPKVKGVVFSVAWIQNQTESENPINDLLFKKLIKDLEKEIRHKKKRRIFDEDDDIKLNPSTTLKVVRELEHKDFHLMDEDVHGRMFESFLDATVRGTELGQFFTPRDVVNLMVALADIQVSKESFESVLDACCGSGGFLISAMASMIDKSRALVGMTNVDREALEDRIRNYALLGIDAGSDPPIHRVARMNMYLHGDGGSNIYFADALDKSIGQIGKSDLEIDDEIKHLKVLLLDQNTKFDVVLSNPPFSMKYSRDHREQEEILNQYDIGGFAKKVKSLPSSVMFLERYKELVATGGRILAVIDESILSGESYSTVREYIRDQFIITGIVSLPGDAFKRADARVKTSILILRLRHPNEQQGDIFMETSVYLGLTAKTAKRIGISRTELAREKPQEVDRIVSNFKLFLEGKPGGHVVSTKNIEDRLDVKNFLFAHDDQYVYLLDVYLCDSTEED